MTTFLFIRHADTDMAGTFCGHSDPDLNERGLERLSALVEQLSSEKIEKVVSSDLRRAQTTAHALAHPRGFLLELQPRLREISFGEWEGLSWNQIEERDPVYAAEWLATFPQLPAPGGESFQVFKARVLSALDGLTTSIHGPIAVITHAGVLRVVSQYLFGCTELWPETQPYCGLLRYESNVPALIGENK